MLDFFRSKDRNIKNDVLSGLTVALALVPEAVAFAFVAGVSPIIGLYSAFFIGLFTAVLGGRPGMISGAAGSMAVIIVSLVAVHGVEYLFPTVVLCGLIQISVGLFRFGKFIRMVPHPVMLGFVNGLAIVIFMAQLGSFNVLSPAGRLVHLSGPPLWIMLGFVGVTMSIIWLLPKCSRMIPASLAAILIVSGLSAWVNSFADRSLAWPGQRHIVLTVGDMLLNEAKAKAVEKSQPGLANAQAAMASVDTASVGLRAGLPRLFFRDYFLPPIRFSTLWIILPFAITLAAVGPIESLMTLTLIDEITETKGRSNRECVGQGAANFVCGLFGGMGGCAMIGQSLININSGGRGRLSGVVASVSLLLFMLFLSRWIEMIPISALVGVMFMVVIGTFEWASLRMFGKMPKADLLVMSVVTLYTAVARDLATAVLIGIVLSALTFAWQHAKHIRAETKIEPDGLKSYQLHGALFFASVTSFKDLFDAIDDPDSVAIDFHFTRVYDQSGLEAINAIAERYREQGKGLHLRHLSPECRQLLNNAKEFVEVNVSEDPHYHVASDRIW